MTKNSLFSQEYKRLLFSPASLILLFSVAVSLLSYYMTYQEKLMFIDQLMHPDPDINIQALAALIDRYTGIRFLICYWFGDLSIIETAGLYLWAGVFLAAVPYGFCRDGFGNFLVSRIGYRRYHRSILMAEIAYIFTIVAVGTFLQLITACFVGGWRYSSYSSVGHFLLTPFRAALLIVARIVIFSAYVSSMTVLVSCLDFIFRNRFLLQSGLLLIAAAVYLLCGSVGNLHLPFGNLLYLFTIDNVHNGIDEFLNNPYPVVFAEQMLPLGCFSIAAFLAYGFNCHVYKRQYL